jgi:hypothetical protein
VNIEHKNIKNRRCSIEMKQGKKTMAALAVVLLLAMATAAAASGVSGKMHGRRRGDGYGWRHGGGYGWGHMGPGYGPERDRGCGPRGENRANRPDRAEIPQDIRDKMAESEKLSIDLRNIMSGTEIDRGRALDAFRRQRALDGEIAEWFFTQRLDRLAERTERTENSGDIPAPRYR